MTSGLDYTGQAKRIMTKTCRNCGTWMHWGVLCSDCSRIYGIGTTVGTIQTCLIILFIQWLLR